MADTVYHLRQASTLTRYARLTRNRERAAELLRLAEQHTFDLILLDVEMPVLDGLAACRLLRADPRLKTVPIIMLTARSGEEAVMLGFAEGATDYMTKPFAVAQFRARVRSWLTRAAPE